ncbi:MAG: hypothetical protein WCK85_09555 [Chlorobium sp.]
MDIQADLNSIDCIFKDIAVSDEARIQKIQTVFQSSENIKESCQVLVESVQNSLDYLKKRRTAVDAMICDILAKKGSLRKKDYNAMMVDIYKLLDAKEEKAKGEFLTFIEEQNEFTQALKNIILKIVDFTSPDAAAKTLLLKTELSEIAKLQEQKKDAIMKILLGFQNTHKNIMGYLESLLEKADGITVKDIKKIKYMINKEIN